MQNLRRDAIHLRNRFDAMTPDGFAVRRVSRVEGQLDGLLEATVVSDAARKLRNRY